MAYLPETYAAAATWFEETVISYVPDAKTPGTKSAERYARYSQGRTIVEAKRLGSKAEDLYHDFEKGFLIVAAVQPDMEKCTPMSLGRGRYGQSHPKLAVAEAQPPAPERPERIVRPWVERPVERPPKATVQEAVGSSGAGGSPVAEMLEKKEEAQRAEAAARLAEKLEKRQAAEKLEKEKLEKKEKKQAAKEAEKKDAAPRNERMAQLRKEKRELMHTLMAALGLDFRLAVDLKAATDNHDMMAERLMADRMAQLVLETAEEQGRRITDKEVLAVLKLWHFKKNEARQNVIPGGQKWVHSDTFGLVRIRTGAWCMTSATQEYPHVTKVLNTWFKARCPEELEGTDFPCTSISLNSNYAAKRHRDGNNAGPSMIRGFGSYTGGELAYWPDDDRSTYVEELHHEDRKVMDISKGLVLFDGCRGHEVDDFQGERFSVVWFNAGKYWTMGKENRDFLHEVGFGALETQDLGPVMKMLPTPRGYTGRGCKSLSSMFGVAEKQQPAKVMQWPDGTVAREEEQAEKLLSGLTTELDAFVRVKELVDAETHAKNIADEEMEEEESKESEKPAGVLDTLFSRAAAADKGKEESKLAAFVEPASPPPTSRGLGSMFFNAELSSEKRRAPPRTAPQGGAEDVPPSKRSRQGEEAAAAVGVGGAAAANTTQQPARERALDLLSEDFQPELAANQEDFRRGEFRSLVRALESRSERALANYFRLALHSAKDPEGRLRAALALLAPALRLPERVLRQAAAQVLGRPVSTEEELPAAVLAGRPAQQATGRPPLTVFKAAEVLRSASDGLARSRGGAVRLAEEEAKAAGCISELFAAVNGGGTDANVLVALLRGDGPISRGSALEALGHAFALTRPPFCAFGGPAETRSFSSSEAKRAYVAAMGKVVPQAFGGLGGSCEELLAVLMEDVLPGRLIARCGPRAGTPALPMDAVQTSDVDEVSSRLAGFDVAAELRYAGKRVQIHRLGDCIAIFGRDQQDLGASLGKGQLAALRAALTSKACVLDAVAVCSGEGAEDVCFMAFDCLCLDGHTLTRQGLSERHEALRRTVLPCEFLQVAPQERFPAESPPQAEEMAGLLVQAQAASCTGLVLKSLGGTYEAGRTAESWVALTVARP